MAALAFLLASRLVAADSSDGTLTSPGPLLLPPVPEIQIVTPRSEPKPKSSAKPSASPDGLDQSEDTPISFGSEPKMDYVRKKKGTAILVLKSSGDSLIKITDSITNRVHALLWLPDNLELTLLDTPPSDYEILFCQSFFERPDGSRYAAWFARVDGEIIVRPGSRIRVNLGITSATHRIVPSTGGEFDRLSVPGRD